VFQEKASQASLPLAIPTPHAAEGKRRVKRLGEETGLTPVLGTLSENVSHILSQVVVTYR